MSNDIQLPGIDKAAELIDAVYADAFFAKLAEYGYQPQNADDAVAMLQTGLQTDYLPAAEKQAAASPFVRINEQLSQVLQPQNVPSFEDGIKQAAFALATDADVYKAVLAIKSAQAEQYLQAEAAANKPAA